MALTVTEINKIKDSIYEVAVQDSLDNNREYRFKYNYADGAAVLEAKVKTAIKEQKDIATDEGAVETKIKTTIEAIDTTKI